ncbi:MAG TPA: hypothetical protein PKC28_06705, partial [Bdellovibrionales bacterium]|nr:hypothetical protein [Bdellovibrionales bacterium]
MVNSLVKTAGAFALAFFIAGLGWGAYSRQLQKAVLASRTPLRVLCADNWLSETRLKEFSKRHNVQIQLYTYTRPTEFLSQMANANGRIDVICTSSLILKSLVQNRWLAKQEFSDLANLQFVSV